MNETLIAHAPTARGWHIGIVRYAAYTTGADVFEVVRISPQHKSLAITRHDNEADARQQANREWKMDRDAATGGVAR